MVTTLNGKAELDTTAGASRFPSQDNDRYAGWLSEVNLRIEAVELYRLDNGVEDGGACASSIYAMDGLVSAPEG